MLVTYKSTRVLYFAFHNNDEWGRVIIQNQNAPYGNRVVVVVVVVVVVRSAKRRRTAEHSSETTGLVVRISDLRFEAVEQSLQSRPLSP